MVSMKRRKKKKDSTEFGGIVNPESVKQVSEGEVVKGVVRPSEMIVNDLLGRGTRRVKELKE